MAKGSIVQTIEQITSSIITGLGMELIDAEYVKEGKDWYLRLYIDKPGGIGIEDCQCVNDAVSDIIDEADPIPGAYIFEVCSPGLERPLKKDRDFERVAGEIVEVSLYAPLNGSKQYEGTLVKKEGTDIFIRTENGEMVFSQKDVAVVKRSIRFH